MKVSGAFFYENIWRNKIVSCPKVQTDGTGNYLSLIHIFSMKREGISLGRTGYSFKISYINSNDKDIIPVFILNSDNTIRKDPFFYRCDGGLCFDYLKECEEKYRTNVTESIEEK